MSLSLSKLGYGCCNLGGYGHKVEIPGHRLIHLAYDMGIRFFDTADQYGTEAVLGKALGSYAQRWPLPQGRRKGASPKNILASCEASLKRLQTDYIDL